MHQIIDKINKAPELGEYFSVSIQGQINICPQLISFVNPYSYMKLRRDESCSSAVDFYYSDAISSSLLFSLLLRRKVSRISFDYGSFGLDFLTRVATAGAPVYFIGAQENEIEKTIGVFKANHPGLNVVGYRHGYFTHDDQASIVADEIVATGAKYVVCGMGTPYQELFGRLLKDKGAGVIAQIYTCGGFLHQSKANIRYYPELINRFHLRWLYRSIKEKHVLKRLMVQYPQFLLYVILDFIFYTE